MNAGLDGLVKPLSLLLLINVSDSKFSFNAELNIVAKLEKTPAL
jgi:hypothetical protein